MPPRPRSHSYTAPATTKETKQASSALEVPHLPVKAQIRLEDRAVHNLRVLRRHDPTIISILEQIPFAALRVLEPAKEPIFDKKSIGPEGPIFIVERQTGKAESTLAFVILGTKDYPSWIQPLHLEDEIEFSQEMIFIVPRSQKNVMWPVINLKASQGLYAPYLIRLIARCHLLARYQLPFPDKWKPVLNSSETAKPMREQDILKMFMTPSRIAEIERVADEIVSIVAAGGSWCRNEWLPPDGGWPEGWVEPMGSTEDVWHIYGEDKDPNMESSESVAISIEDTSKSKRTQLPSTPKKGQKNRQSKSTSKSLTPDVMMSIVGVPQELKPAGSLAPPAKIDDAARTPTPADFKAALPTDENEPTSGRSPRPRQKNKKSRNGVTGTPVDKLRSTAQSNTISRLSTPGPPRVGTPAFGLVDDRASDSDDEVTGTTSGSPSPPPPKANGTSLEVPVQINGLNGTQSKQMKNGTPKVQKYHERGYIPHNSPRQDHKELIDTNIARDSIVNAVQKEGDRFTVLERNDWIRELLSLIHTKKDFVDALYNDYKAKCSS